MYQIINTPDAPNTEYLQSPQWNTKPLLDIFLRETTFPPDSIVLCETFLRQKYTKYFLALQTEIHVGEMG
jgi:hypothetical protein